MLKANHMHFPVKHEKSRYPQKVIDSASVEANPANKYFINAVRLCGTNSKKVKLILPCFLNDRNALGGAVL